MSSLSSLLRSELFFLWYLSLEDLSVLCIVSAQNIVDDALLWNVVLTTNFETLHGFILK